MKQDLIKYLLFFFAVTSVVSVYAFTNTNEEQTAGVTEEKGIKFIEQDWNQALSKAKAENKLIFVDIYATWCGPCKMLKKNTFSDDTIAEFFNKNFINVSVDGERTVGTDLVQKYSVQAYPTLIVTDAEGKPVLYTMGYMTADQLMRFAKEALKRKS